MSNYVALIVLTAACGGTSVLLMFYGYIANQPRLAWAGVLGIVATGFWYYLGLAALSVG